MTVYLDTSALVKLLVRERETDTLRSWLSTRQDSRRVTSALARTELRRAVLRREPALLPAADDLLSRLSLVRVDDVVLDAAGVLAPAGLRSLDALHLASALQLGPLHALVTFDERMADGARRLGLRVEAPGSGATAAP